jgi:integrase
VAITKQQGRKGYLVQVYAGIDPVTGRQRYKSARVDGKRAAERLEAKLKTEVAAGRHRGTGAKTLGDLLDVWWEWRQANGRPLSPTTANDYESLMVTKIKPALGKLRLAQVDPLTLDRYYRQLRQRGRTVRVCTGTDPKTGRKRWATEQAPLSASRVHQVHAVLSGALGLGAKYGWLPFNPAALAAPPAGKGAQRAVPTPAEVRDLLVLAAERDPELHLFLRLEATTGMRPGEVCALRWRDLDLDGAALAVTGNVVHARGLEGGYVRKGPKREPGAGGDQGDRVLALDVPTVALLRVHLVRCARRARTWGGRLARDAYLFSVDLGGRRPVRRDSISRYRFAPLAAELGHGYTLYGLRHFMATQLGKVATAATVRERMRHSSLAVTSVYVHPVSEADRDAARYMGDLLDQRAEGTSGRGDRAS